MSQGPSEKEEFLAWQQDLEADDKGPTLDRPTVFRWTGDGKEVYLSGSFNNWANKIPLIRRWGKSVNGSVYCWTHRDIECQSCSAESGGEEKEKSRINSAASPPLSSVKVRTPSRPSLIFLRGSISTSSTWTASGPTTQQRSAAVHTAALRISCCVLNHPARDMKCIIKTVDAVNGNAECFCVMFWRSLTEEKWDTQAHQKNIPSTSLKSSSVSLDCNHYNTQGQVPNNCHN